MDFRKYNLRNVTFLGDATHLNSVDYKRVNPKTLTLQDRDNLVTFESCKHKDEKGVCCELRCVWAVVKRTPAEVRKRKDELKNVYPMWK